MADLIDWTLVNATSWLACVCDRRMAVSNVTSPRTWYSGTAGLDRGLRQRMATTNFNKGGYLVPGSSQKHASNFNGFKLLKAAGQAQQHNIATTPKAKLGTACAIQYDNSEGELGNPCQHY